MAKKKIIMATFNPLKMASKIQFEANFFAFKKVGISSFHWHQFLLCRSSRSRPTNVVHTNRWRRERYLTYSAV